MSEPTAADRRAWGSGELDPDAYLKRTGYRGPLEPTADTLRELHRPHHLPAKHPSVCSPAIDKAT